MKWTFVAILSFIYFGSWSQAGDDLPILNGVYLTDGVTWSQPSRINSERMEFSPAWYGDGIVFVGDERSGKSPFFRLWYAPLENGDPLAVYPYRLPGDSITHEGPLSFSPDGSRAFFTRSNVIDGVPNSDEKYKVRLTIFTAVKDAGGKWGRPVRLPFNAQSHDCGHPAWDEDGMRLIFASNMPGGYGGMDLYWSEWDGSQWSLPVNIGPAVNSDANEFFPFYHPAGYLFFSSDRKGGKGGYDQYVSMETDRTFTKPVLLPPPFNSNSDDFGLILDADAKSGFYTSNRKGTTGGDDLFRLESGVSLLGIREVPEEIRILVVDSSTGDPVTGAGLLALPVGNMSSDAGREWFEPVLENLSDRPGEFVIRYRLRKDIDPEQYLHYTDEYGKQSLVAEEGENYLLQVQAEGYEWTRKLITRREWTEGEEIRIPLTLYRRELTEIGFRDVTDRSVYDINLVITDRSTGETRYLITGKEEPFSYEFEPGRTYTLSVEKEGYLPQTVSYSTEVGPPLFILEEVPAELPAEAETDRAEEPGDEGAVIVLEDIFYDYDQYSIRADQAYELEILADLLLQFPDIHIELSAHTDSRGPSDYNYELSRKRAEEAKKFLIKKGIDAERIQTVGYGETRLRNDCADGVDCTEEEHRYNRRTEVKILEQ